MSKMGKISKHRHTNAAVFASVVLQQGQGLLQRENNYNTEAAGKKLRLRPRMQQGGMQKGVTWEELQIGTERKWHEPAVIIKPRPPILTFPKKAENMFLPHLVQFLPNLFQTVYQNCFD